MFAFPVPFSYAIASSSPSFKSSNNELIEIISYSMSYFLLTLIYFDLLPKYVIVADSIILFPRRVSQIANQFQESHSFCRSDVSWLSYRWSPVYSHTGNQFSAIFSTNFSTNRLFRPPRKKQNPLQTAVYKGLSLLG